MLEENVVMVINQQRQWVQKQKEPSHQLLKRRFCNSRQKKEFMNNNHQKLCSKLIKGIYNHHEKLHNKVSKSYYHNKQRKTNSIMAQKGTVLSY